jgi:hypothetical protein
MISGLDTSTINDSHSVAGTESQRQPADSLNPLDRLALVDEGGGESHTHDHAAPDEFSNTPRQHTERSDTRNIQRPQPLTDDDYFSAPRASVTTASHPETLRCTGDPTEASASHSLVENNRLYNAEGRTSAGEVNQAESLDLCQALPAEFRDAFDEPSSSFDEPSSSSFPGEEPAAHCSVGSSHAPPPEDDSASIPESLQSGRSLHSMISFGGQRVSALEEANRVTLDANVAGGIPILRIIPDPNPEATRAALWRQLGEDVMALELQRREADGEMLTPFSTSLEQPAQHSVQVEGEERICFFPGSDEEIFPPSSSSCVSGAAANSGGDSS